MVVIVLLYYKTYMTQELVGISCEIDQANVSRLLQKMLPLMEKAADSQFATYLKQAKEEFERTPPHQRTNNVADFFRKHPDLREVATGTGAGRPTCLEFSSPVISTSSKSPS